jgi:membrane-bound serine protease (ClpP class)
MLKIVMCIVALLASFMGTSYASMEKTEQPLEKKKVYILPIREDIMPPLVYLVRRGVKEAMEAKADLLLLDMETNGGRVDVTEEIISIIGQFKGKTATYVNRKAFSAGAFIAVATQKIFMAPQSVIGAAAPILMMPGGGVEKTPDTMEVKITSGIRALIRTSAEKNGHNKDVVEAMIDKSKELTIDGEVLNEKGQILTLTNREAEKEYGNPSKPLLSLGTFEDIPSLLNHLGYSQAEQIQISASGAEKLAFWLNLISPVLLIIGAVGIYIEFKTPGFGLPGIIGITAFAIYFLGGYVGGLTGLEWAAVFLIGLGFIAVELFVFPGTAILGVVGIGFMMASIIMGMVDFYPGMPLIPTIDQLEVPLRGIVIAGVGSIVMILLLKRWLPQTPFYNILVSQSVSGSVSVEEREKDQQYLIGKEGVTISVLRPGGKAQFGEEILDAISQGDMVAKGTRVKMIGFSATEAIVEAAGK